jgi:hypothetical protein
MSKLTGYFSMLLYREIDHLQSTAIREGSQETFDECANHVKMVKEAIITLENLPERVQDDIYVFLAEEVAVDLWVSISAVICKNLSL